jgi:hypothetical protein
MSGEPPDFYQWLRDLTERSVADQARALQRYNELMQRVLRGELTGPQVSEEYTRFAREQSTRYANDLTQLSLGYYSALLELGRSYSDHFYDRVLRSQPPPAPPAAGAARAPRQVSLALQGAAGEEAALSFVIENKHSTPAEISFVVSEFVDAAGGDPFRASLRFQPEQFALGAHEEAVVTLRLSVLPELFVPGHHYRSTVVVRGYDELELVLNLTVPAARASTDQPVAEPPAPAESPPAEQLAARARAKKAGNGRAKRSRTSQAG